MANSLDKFRKGVAQWSGNIGSAGISDAVVKTVPLASTSGLPTDTAVMITVNRVDTNGKKTGNYEGIVGVVSGSNLIDCIRGVEGTAQAWTGGTVVEVLHTAANVNDLIDGILAEHDQEGKHTPALVTTLKASGSAVNTGTNDTKIVTPKALSDSDYVKSSQIEVTPSSTTTFTNKRNQKRAYSDTSVATLTPEIDTYDTFDLTEQDEDLTIANHTTSTPEDGEMMLFTLKCDGTNRAITWDTNYATLTAELPATLTANKITVILLRWLSSLSKWACLTAQTEE